jgi:hypothetical protein
MRKLQKQELEMRFEWTQPQDADCYYWAESEKEFFGRKYKRHFLMREGARTNTSYSPLKDAALFASFADIPHTKRTLRLWANQYGRLTEGFEAHSLPGASLLALENFTPPESLKFYRTAHKRLAFAVTLWECIKNKDEDTLCKILEVNEDRTGASFRMVRRDQLPNLDQWIEHVEEEEYGDNDVESAAHDILVFDLGQKNRDLDDFGVARFCLNVYAGSHLKNNPVEMRRDDEGRAFLEPTSLLACMWYQLGAAIDGKVQLRRCEICGQWEDMEGHNKNWTCHKKCANNEAVKRYRTKRDNLKSRMPF